ncbi:MAG TPA: hypothetical protein VG168_07505 [Bryobacteraceae bacterium]|nr:hypothetical protein [Bryobacteraceae bacterium]
MGSRLRNLGAAFGLLILGVLLACGSAQAQGGPRWLSIEFPQDSPVLPVSSDLGPIVSQRGMSMVVGIHTSLMLRNTGSRTICGLTLRVEAPDLTPSGKGSFTVPSLMVRPGEVFPVRMDTEVKRPFGAKTEGPIIQISLDCVLFSDLTAYGPDKLNSRRALVVYELEARRDRKYLAALMQSQQWTQLRQELNFGLVDLNPPQLGFELLRGTQPMGPNEQAIPVGVVPFRGSPVQPMGGAAKLSGNEIRVPQVDVKNTSQKAVRNVEMGWILRDERGRDFVAGSVATPVSLGPVQSGRLTEQGTLRFSQPGGQPMTIDAVMAFINDVEYADGNFWIPSRRDILDATSDPILRRALSTSPEQQRLAEVYRRKGMSGLEAELTKLK